jgi:hypothetical protein
MRHHHRRKAIRAPSARVGVGILKTIQTDPLQPLFQNDRGTAEISDIAEMAAPIRQEEKFRPKL